MGAEYFATGARWRQLLDEYYGRLVGDDPVVEPKRPVRPDDEDIEIEPPDPSSFTQGNPFAKAPDGGGTESARSFAPPPQSPAPPSPTAGAQSPDGSTDPDDGLFTFLAPHATHAGAAPPVRENLVRVAVGPGDDDFDGDTDSENADLDEPDSEEAGGGDEPGVDDDGDNA